MGAAPPYLLFRQWFDLARGMLAFIIFISNGHGDSTPPQTMKAMTVPSPPTPLPRAGEGRFVSRRRDFHIKINPVLTSPVISLPQAHSWVEIRASFRLRPRWTRLFRKVPSTGIEPVSHA